MQYIVRQLVKIGKKKKRMRETRHKAVDSFIFFTVGSYQLLLLAKIGV